ncbi:MAG: MFS transporter [Acidobacteriota bacterium]|nr:MFS transporter [Acidobacteriota bacterium]
MSELKSRRSVIAWCLYDFANSPFTTLVVTFIYAAYFSKAMVLGPDGEPDEILGTALWSRAVTLTAITVALLSPFMGALADSGGYRKKFLLTATMISLLTTAGLFFAEPGQVLLALVMFTIGNIAFEMGMVFYNAFLPDITDSDKVGRISGIGWGLGYLGGLLALVLALVGFVQTETPWFGFSKELGENIRATNIMVAVWFLVFSLPLFLWVKEAPVSGGGSSFKATAAQLKQTFVDIRRYRQIVRFLIARLVYNDGLVTIFAFGGIYAAGTFDFEIAEILVFGIVLNITAGAGAFAMGFLDDKLGGKRTIIISLLGLFLGTLLAVLAPDRTWFWAGGILVGIFSGPNQSASRSLMARFVPHDKENEFFGFFAFSGKATAFLGPLFLGLLTQMFNSQRVGVSIVLVMLAVGLILLLRVDEDEGIAVAKESN